MLNWQKRAINPTIDLPSNTFITARGEHFVVGLQNFTIYTAKLQHEIDAQTYPGQTKPQVTEIARNGSGISGIRDTARV